MYFFRINYKDQVYIQKRVSKDIWENLYQFVLLEAKSKISDAQLTSGEVIRKLLGKTSYLVSSISPEKVQLLTHQTIKGCFVTISIDHPMLIKGYHRIPESELSGLAFPKFITSSM